MYDEIIEKLSEKYDKNIQEVENFARGVTTFLKNDKNAWAKQLDLSAWCWLFSKVANEWIWFDWINVTYNKRWISYNYASYINKMLSIYPESLIDLQLVYKEDTVEFSKDSWKVTYTHKLKNPFTKKDEEIIWGYMVIKNRKWEFLTTLTKEDFDKAKSEATTLNIWNKYLAAMCMKTIVKRWVKVHFNDIYISMEDEDNKQYDFSLGEARDTKEWMDDIVDKITENKE